MRNLIVFFALTQGIFGQTVVGLEPPVKVLAIAVISDGPKQSFAPEEMLYGKLASSDGSVRFVSVRKSFLADFEKIYDGEPAVIQKALLSAKSDRILVGRMSYSFRPSKSVAHDVVCDLSFSYKIMNQSGDVLRRGVVIAHGLGFSEGQSFEGAIDHLVQSSKLN